MAQLVARTHGVRKVAGAEPATPTLETLSEGTKLELVNKEKVGGII